MTRQSIKDPASSTVTPRKTQSSPGAADSASASAAGMMPDELLLQGGQVSSSRRGSLQPPLQQQQQQQQGQAASVGLVGGNLLLQQLANNGLQQFQLQQQQQAPNSNNISTMLNSSGSNGMNINNGNLASAMGMFQAAMAGANGNMAAGGNISFAQRLYRVLAMGDVHKESIAWMPHGRCFRVVNPQRLEQEVLHKYFEFGTYFEFVAQLNSHGFISVPRGRDMYCFYHEVCCSVV
jgi:hypothetical protein